MRTPAGAIWTGALVLLALGVLTPYFQYIPQASLAAVIIVAVILMVDYEIVPKLFKVKSKPASPYVVSEQPKLDVTFIQMISVSLELDLLPLAITFFLTLFVNIEVRTIPYMVIPLSPSLSRPPSLSLPPLCIRH